MDDQETLHNRLRQNQAYNDHIVSQQAKIVAKFDKVESLEERVKSLENLSYIAAEDEQKLRNDLDQHKSNYDHETFSIKDDLLHLGDFHVELKTIVDDLKNTIEMTVIDIYKQIEEVKSALSAFKKEISLNWSMIISDAKSSQDQNRKALSDHFIEVSKMVPETPPYIQDLKDTVNHKLHIFEIEVGKAVDKANHAEILYKVLEKRTRQ